MYGHRKLWCITKQTISGPYMPSSLLPTASPLLSPRSSPFKMFFLLFSPPPPTSLTRSPAEYSICFAACITSTHSRNAIKTPDKQFAHPDKCNENICSAFSALLQVLLHQNRVLSPQRRNVNETTFYFLFFSSFSFAAQLLKPCPLKGRTPD